MRVPVCGGASMRGCWIVEVLVCRVPVDRVPVRLRQWGEGWCGVPMCGSADVWLRQ